MFNLFLNFFPLLSLGFLFLAVGFRQCISSQSLSSESWSWYTILLWAEGPGIGSAFSLSWFCKVVMVCPGVIFCLTSYLALIGTLSQSPNFLEALSWCCHLRVAPHSHLTVHLRCSFILIPHPYWGVKYRFHENHLQYSLLLYSLEGASKATGNVALGVYLLNDSLYATHSKGSSNFISLVQKLLSPMAGTGAWNLAPTW